ncbi:MAG: hypothetical protein ABSG51_10325, partial [Terracidiphilus sp.]
NKIARMVEGHEDHGEASDDVDGGNSPIAPVCNWKVGGVNRNLLFSALIFWNCNARGLNLQAEFTLV